MTLALDKSQLSKRAGDSTDDDVESQDTHGSNGGVPPVERNVLENQRELKNAPSQRGEETDDTENETDGPEGESQMYQIPDTFLTPGIPDRPRREKTYDARRKWEGVVEKVDGDEFTARLRAIDDDVPDEVVALRIGRVSEEDRELIEPGAVFYWNIGESRTSDGQLENYSEIRFRRLPKHTGRDRERAERQASDLREEIFGGDAE